MSLDVYLNAPRVVQVYSDNITHNLNTMAEVVGIYDQLWRPDEIGITKASQLIEPLTDALKRLMDAPEKFARLNPKNGWGSYDELVQFVRAYRDACEASPDADVEVSR